MVITLPEPNVAVSYLRFSDPKQEEGDTVRRQTKARNAWLALNQNVRLDQSLMFEDKGASGFSRKHRTNPRYQLAQLVERVEGGDIPRGAYLVVENLDRLTREHWSDSVPFVLDLILKGIRIVQVIPKVIVYDLTMDRGTLMMMLMELARGNEESELKSERVGEEWDERHAAALNGTPHGGKIPAWITVADGKYKLLPGPAKIVKTILRWSKQGLGLGGILRRLEADSIPSLTNGRWHRGYIALLLTTRTVVGEYQRTRVRDGERKPVGPPIPAYYPALINETEWAEIQQAKRARFAKSGRPPQGAELTSPFAGLLYSASDGFKMRVDKTPRGRWFRSQTSKEGLAKRSEGKFYVDHFVSAVLIQLQELSTSDLFNEEQPHAIEELASNVADVRQKLAHARERFEGDKFSQTWADLVDKYDKELRILSQEMAEARQRTAHPLSATWAEAVELMRRNDPLRLRQCLLTTVKAVWCRFVPRKKARVAAVQVWFADSQQHRDYLIFSRTPLGPGAKDRKGSWVSCSPEGLLPPGGFDLREHDQAEAVAAILADMDLSVFDSVPNAKRGH